ncbi:MAG: hypothetical protein Greene041619_373 [Candidatus Peregrinibacteria bacterium Greene0416_19]|nr:MAG: hypothetical protein Greene041619_373 [Candidatus Peregrinibacteria bacterium Greene0416_19]
MDADRELASLLGLRSRRLRLLQQLRVRWHGAIAVTEPIAESDSLTKPFSVLRRL